MFKLLAITAIIVLAVSLFRCNHDITLTTAYSGPIFPLTLTEKNDSISAERNLAYNFSATDTEDSVNGDCRRVHVVDSYTLTNESNKDISVNFIYPFVGVLSILDRPQITVDGAIVETDLYAGAYCGGFTGVGKEKGTVNLKSFISWEEYKTLLKDGTYIQNHGNIEMVRQNYGFVLDNGVTAVKLNPNIECLYMEMIPHIKK